MGLFAFTFKCSDSVDLFAEDERSQLYMDMIRKRPEPAEQKTQLRNRRFLAMERLCEQGDYFSLEKMRERAPLLFDTMLDGHLHDCGECYAGEVICVQRRLSCDRAWNSSRAPSSPV